MYTATEILIGILLLAGLSTAASPETVKILGVTHILDPNGVHNTIQDNIINKHTHSGGDITYQISPVNVTVGDDTYQVSIALNDQDGSFIRTNGKVFVYIDSRKTAFKNLNLTNPLTNPKYEFVGVYDIHQSDFLSTTKRIPNSNIEFTTVYYNPQLIHSNSIAFPYSDMCTEPDISILSVGDNASQPLIPKCLEELTIKTAYICVILYALYLWTKMATPYMTLHHLISTMITNTLDALNVKSVNGQ